MSFLELKPAARHLRRVARAHAAGEIQRQDYRKVRRKIIEDLHIDFSENRSTDSAPYDSFSLGEKDKTRRRNQGLDSRPKNQTIVEDSQELEVRSSPNIDRVKSQSNSRLLLFIIACLFLVFATFGSDAIFIPAVSERDPNPNNSLTLSLAELHVENFEALPNLSRAEVEAFLSEQLIDAREQAGVDRLRGFSGSELAELGDLLLRLGIQSKDGLDATAIQALNALAQKQLNRRGVSVVQLERIAERLEAYYRQRGYLTARAYVPSQEVVADRVVLHVLPGRIVEIAVDSEAPLARVVKRAFSIHEDQVAHRDSLEALFYKVNSLPGVRATGSLSAGAAVGDTRLNVALNNPRKLNTTLSFDNFGDSRSSTYRLGGSVDWLNPTGRGDLLATYIGLRFNPEEAVDASILYETPGFRLGDTASATFSFGNFGVERPDGLSVIDGRTQTLTASYQRLVAGRRSNSLTVGGAATLQKLELEETTQELWWLSPNLKAHRVFDSHRWVLRGGLDLVAGGIGSSRYQDQPSRFFLGKGWLSAWRPLGRQSMRLDISGQVATKDLPDSHKLPLGGQRRNLSLRPGDFVADSAILAGIEITATPAPWQEFGDLQFFSRMSHGQVRTSADSESAFVWDGGIAWQLPQNRPLSGAIRLSFPFVRNGIEDSHDRARLFFDLDWRL